MNLSRYVVLLCLGDPRFLDGSLDDLDESFRAFYTINEEVGEFGLIHVLVGYQYHSRTGAGSSQRFGQALSHRFCQRVAHKQNATFATFESGECVVLVEGG